MLESTIIAQLTEYPSLIGCTKWYIVIKTGHLRYVQQNVSCSQLTDRLPGGFVTSLADLLYQTIVSMLKKVEDNGEKFVRAIEFGIF